MPDQVIKNLEPIEEGDLDLKDKFLGKAAPEKVAPAAGGASVERVPVPETAPEKIERKEGAVEKEEAYMKILSTASPSQAPQDDQVANDADVTSKEKDAESKIVSLVNLAQVKGVPHAVKVARHLEDNYLLDEFHDKLLGEELHNALLKKGLIKEL